LALRLRQRFFRGKSRAARYYTRAAASRARSRAESEKRRGDSRLDRIAGKNPEEINDAIARDPPKRTANDSRVINSSGVASCGREK